MINAQIGATKGWNGQYTVDCANVPNLPDLTLYFDHTPYVLKGTDYILEVQGTCMSAFTGLDMPNGMNLWIVGKFNVSRCMLQSTHSRIGDVFLRKYYTVYDLENDAVGFALAK